jgi:hypothetical protein
LFGIRVVFCFCSDKMRKGIKMPDPWEIIGSLGTPHKDQEETENSSGVETDKYLRETQAHAELLFHFTKVLVMNDVFRQHGLKKEVSKYCTAGMEAFLVLTYVNSYASWYEDCKGVPPPNSHVYIEHEESDTSTISQTEASTSTPGTKISKKMFTDNPRGKGKHNGWAGAGRALHAKIAQVIKHQRTNPECKPVLARFEMELLDRFKGEKSSTGRHATEEEVPDFDELHLALAEEV